MKKTPPGNKPLPAFLQGKVSPKKATTVGSPKGMPGMKPMPGPKAMPGMKPAAAEKPAAKRGNPLVSRSRFY
ncbi:MAG: hypothetical protein EBT04_02400 [Betaproteobacteria bacterium]|nr:hypothetical protein [Betaproteobacteria bacterium]